MTLIADWLQALGGAGLDLFWRPLLAWTLVFLPLYGALRLWRSAPALVQYHAHLALLLRSRSGHTANDRYPCKAICPRLFPHAIKHPVDVGTPLQLFEEFVGIVDEQKRFVVDLQIRAV